VRNPIHDLVPDLFPRLPAQSQAPAKPYALSLGKNTRDSIRETHFHLDQLLFGAVFNSGFVSTGVTQEGDYASR